jgi:hypothetical protein
VADGPIHFPFVNLHFGTSGGWSVTKHGRRRALVVAGLIAAGFGLWIMLDAGNRPGSGTPEPPKPLTFTILEDGSARPLFDGATNPGFPLTVRFKEADGREIRPEAFVRLPSAGEVRLVEAPDGASLRTSIMLPTGKYSLVAVDAQCGWTQEYDIAHETPEVHTLAFGIPRESLLVRVLDPEGRPFHGEIQYAVSEHLQIAARREIQTGLVPGLSAGFPITSRRPPAQQTTQAQASVAGPEFKVERKRGATLHLALLADGDLGWSGWVSSLSASSTCVIRLRPLSSARFEVFHGGEHAVEGATVQACTANTSHPDWKRPVDANGRVALRGFDRLFAAAFLLRAPEAEESGLPLAYLTLWEDPFGMRETGSLMQQDTGAALRFPATTYDEWVVRLPKDFQTPAVVTVSVSVRILDRTWLPVGEMTLPAGAASVTLPSWIADAKNVRLTMLETAGCVRLQADAVRKELSLSDLKPLALSISGPDGLALSGAGVKWVDSQGINLANEVLVSSVDGRFELSVPRNGAGSLLVDCPGYISSAIPLESLLARSGVVHVRLSEAATLEIAVRTNLSLEGARITLTKAEGLCAPGDRLEFALGKDGIGSTPLTSGGGAYHASVTLPVEGVSFRRRFEIAAGATELQWILPLLEESSITLKNTQGDEGLCLVGSFLCKTGDLVNVWSCVRADSCRAFTPAGGGEVRLRVIDPSGPFSGPLTPGDTLWLWHGAAVNLPATAELPTEAGGVLTLVGSSENKTIAVSNAGGWRRVVVVRAGAEARLDLPRGHVYPMYVGPAGGLSRSYMENPGRLFCSTLCAEYPLRFASDLREVCGDEESCEIRFESPDAYHWRPDREGDRRIAGPEHAVGWGHIICTDGSEVPFRTRLLGDTLWCECTMTDDGD